MLGVNATVEGAEQLQQGLRWAAEHLPLTTSRGLKRGATLLEGALRKNLSGPILKRRSSTLVRSVGYEADPDGLTFRIGATTFYLAVHEGEAAGRDGDVVVIRAKTSRGLRFQGKRRDGTEGWITLQQVRIPVRRPVGVTYEESGLAALEEAWATVQDQLDAQAPKGGGQ